MTKIEWKDYRCPQESCKFTITATKVPKCQVHKKQSMILKDKS